MPDEKRRVAVIVKDPAHLEAHRAEFAEGLEGALELAAEALGARGRRHGETEAAFAVHCGRIVGYGGLARVRPWTRGDFWAPRNGRSIPSHLIIAKRRPTRFLCVWGEWRDEATFLLHTLYPGKPAPREIHDPALPASELPASIRFWIRHAIVVESR